MYQRKPWLVAGALCECVVNSNKWGKHPACRVVDAIHRKLEAHATETRIPDDKALVPGTRGKQRRREEGTWGMAKGFVMTSRVAAKSREEPGEPRLLSPAAAGWVSLLILVHLFCVAVVLFSNQYASVLQMRLGSYIGALYADVKF